MIRNKRKRRMKTKLIKLIVVELKINKLKIILNIIKDIIHGADGIRLPKILFTVSRETGIPLVDIVNGQLNREGIADKYDYKANMVSGNSNSLLRATQIEYLKAKAPPESTIDQTAKPENIPALSALFDLYRMFSQYDMLQRGMKKYHDNRDQSAVDSLELSYEAPVSDAMYRNTNMGMDEYWGGGNTQINPMGYKKGGKIK